jgi:proteasome lid subunit RPN8/RPN11
MKNGTTIPERVLGEALAEAVARHPDEACGFLIGHNGEAKRFVACHNVQNERHENDPERYPRDARTAYVIEPEEQNRVETEAKSLGMELVAIVHSHPEHDAYFSAEDKANAAPWGEPLFPGLSYVVVSVYGKTVKAANEYYWDDERADFVEKKLV